MLALFCLSAAQPWCAFHSAHILLHANVKNDDVVTGKISNFV